MPAHVSVISDDHLADIRARVNLCFAEPLKYTGWPRRSCEGCPLMMDALELLWEIDRLRNMVSGKEPESPKE